MAQGRNISFGNPRYVLPAQPLLPGSFRIIFLHVVYTGCSKIMICGKIRLFLVMDYLHATSFISFELSETALRRSPLLKITHLIINLKKFRRWCKELVCCSHHVPLRLWFASDKHRNVPSSLFPSAWSTHLHFFLEVLFIQLQPSRSGQRDSAKCIAPNLTLFNVGVWILQN